MTDSASTGPSGPLHQGRALLRAEPTSAGVAPLGLGSQSAFVAWGRGVAAPIDAR
jgi:hypothetical protein